MKPELSVVGIDLAKSIFHLVGMDERGKIISLNFEQFVVDRRGWPRAREGLEGVRVFAGDGLCNGEKMVRFSASVDALQSVIN